MFAPGVLAFADSFSGSGRLQLVAVLLGILVFGLIVLLVERRNSTHEATPPGLTGALHPPEEPPRQVYRAPAAAVPIASAREAAGRSARPAPYAAPFVAPDAETAAEVAPPEQAGAGPEGQ